MGDRRHGVLRPVPGAQLAGEHPRRDGTDEDVPVCGPSGWSTSSKLRMTWNTKRGTSATGPRTSTSAQVRMASGQPRRMQSARIKTGGTPTVTVGAYTADMTGSSPRATTQGAGGPGTTCRSRIPRSPACLGLHGSRHGSRRIGTSIGRPRSIQGKMEDGTGSGTTTSMIRDGTSFTMMISEVLPWAHGLDGRGAWLLNMPGSTNFQALFGPNADGPDQYDVTALCNVNSPLGPAKGRPMGRRTATLCTAKTISVNLRIPSFRR